MSVLSIAAGGTHYLALYEDRTLWTWGFNHHGELGNNTKRDSDKPVPVAGLSDVKAMAGGREFSLAVKSDGTVWAWGRNHDGLLGIGDTKASRLTPCQVKGLTGIVQVAGEWEHCLALKADGTVWGWGSKKQGHLGTGDTKSWKTPRQAKSLHGALAIATGTYLSLALKDDGTVWAWGSNGSGGLGVDGEETRAIPAPVPGLPTITSIAAKGDRALALASDGSVWHWGGASFLERNPRPRTPARVDRLTHVVAVALTHAHALALKEDGTVWASELKGSRVGAPARLLTVENVTAIATSSNGCIARVGSSTLVRLWFRGSSTGVDVAPVADIATLARKRDKAAKVTKKPRKPSIEPAVRKQLAAFNRQLVRHGGPENQIAISELSSYQYDFLEELAQNRLPAYIKTAAEQIGTFYEPEAPLDVAARVKVHLHKLVLPDEDVKDWELVLGGTSFGSPEVVFTFVGWKKKRAVFVD